MEENERLVQLEAELRILKDLLNQENRRDYAMGAQLAHNMWQIARYRVERVDPLPQPYDISNVVQLVTEQYTLAGTSLASDLPPITGDPIGLQRALENLVKNAQEARALGITIHALREGEVVRIVVTDDGEGMSDGRAEQVMQGHSSKHKQEGLGVALVRSYVRSIGGTLSISSKSELGTGITLSLPIQSDIKENNIMTEEGDRYALHDLRNELGGLRTILDRITTGKKYQGIEKSLQTLAKLLPPGRAYLSGEPACNSGSIRLLWIDDYHLTGTIAHAFIGEFGYDVTVVADLETAREAFERAEKQSPYALIILDDRVLAKPGGAECSGLGFLPAMKRITNRDVPILSLAGDDITSDPHYRDAGIVHFARKPVVDLGQLALNVEEVLKYHAA